MNHIEVVRIMFVDGIHRVLFEERKGLSNNGFNWDYLLFGGKLESGELPEDAIKREIIEELAYELRRDEFRHLGAYEAILPGYKTTDHVYVARFPGFNKIRSLESRTIALMDLYSARRTKIPPIYHQIFQDLETALRDPNFLSVLK